MPLALYPWLLFLFLFPLSTWAGPLSTVFSLSPYLTAAVPSCAHGCLRSFVTDNYPTSICPNPSDLTCLCTNDNKLGLTLGEAALRCLASECPKDSTVVNGAVKVYELCSIIPNAKPMTHSTLTATHVVIETVQPSSPQLNTMSRNNPITATPLPSSINRPSSVPATSSQDDGLPFSIVADPNPPSPSPTTTESIFSTGDPFSTSPSTIASPTSTTPITSPSASPTVVAPPPSGPVLTKPQIAGVTVGSIAAAGLVFGFLALVFCLRERKRRRRGSDASFGNDKIVIDQPRTPSRSSAAAPHDLEHGNQEIATPEPYQRAQAPDTRPPSNRWSFWRKSMNPEDIGVAVAPGPAHQLAYERSPVTPMSATSHESSSRLLPDKPIYSLYPPPLRLSSYNTQVSPIDAPGQQYANFRRNSFGPAIRAAPAPRGPRTMDTSQSNLHLGQPTIRAVPSDPFLDASSSSRTTDPRQFQTLPAQRSKSALSPPIIHQSGQWAQPVQLHRKPVPARLAPDGLRIVTPTDQMSFVSELPANPATLAIGSSQSSQTVQPTRRKSSGRRKGNTRRPQTFLSTTTDTSFEDADSDDEPPMPHSTLPTVVESPPSRIRTAGVRYPVVPISAAESPSVNQTVREIRKQQQQQQREQLELNPASDRSMGKARASPNPKTPSPRFDKALPNVPELTGTQLRERQQVPDDSSDRIKPGSAKWSILVAPGLEGIENAGSPGMKSKASTEWTPVSTPTRRAR
ncbi:MAG: hypothetical protein LQ350_008205 [Teloschistes chrysophthalmus]|nr:MAG: hypothetical protein LQ350_008205 [Niorma chrysophthalma]